MKTTDAEKIARDLMVKHKVTDYTFAFDTAIWRFGSCNTHDKRITLSPKLTEINDEAIVTNVILHEIAHALTPGCAHNEVWRRVALAIGSDGQRCYDDDLVEAPTHKWTATCPSCRLSIQRHKKNPRLHCSICYKRTHRFTKSNKFVWHKNKGGKV